MCQSAASTWCGYILPMPTNPPIMISLAGKLTSASSSCTVATIYALQIVVDETAKLRWQISCSLWMLHATNNALVIREGFSNSATGFAAHLLCWHQLMWDKQI